MKNKSEFFIANSFPISHCGDNEIRPRKEKVILHYCVRGIREDRHREETKHSDFTAVKKSSIARRGFSQGKTDRNKPLNLRGTSRILRSML